MSYWYWIAIWFFGLFVAYPIMREIGIRRVDTRYDSWTGDGFLDGATLFLWPISAVCWCAYWVGMLLLYLVMDEWAGRKPSDSSDRSSDNARMTDGGLA